MIQADLNTPVLWTTDNTVYAGRISSLLKVISEFVETRPDLCDGPPFLRLTDQEHKKEAGQKLRQAFKELVVIKKPNDKDQLRVVKDIAVKRLLDVPVYNPNEVLQQEGV